MTRSSIGAPTRRRALRLALAGALAVGSAFAGAPTAPADAAPSHVAIVIAGQGTACVAWHSGITGDEVLNDVASVRYRTDGLIVQIDGVPASAKADDTHYWAYWHDTGSGWRYSSSGASGYQPAAGTVEGWAFNDGGSSAPQPPSASYAAICSDASTPAHVSSPRPSYAPAPRPSSRSGDRVAAPTRAHPSSAVPTPAAGSAASSAARTSTARPASRAAASSSAARSAAAASGTVGPTSSAATLRPLTRLAAHHSSGSPLPLVLTGVLVVLLGGGAAAAALRRRTGRA